MGCRLGHPPVFIALNVHTLVNASVPKQQYPCKSSQLQIDVTNTLKSRESQKCYFDPLLMTLLTAQTYIQTMILATLN